MEYSSDSGVDAIGSSHYHYSFHPDILEHAPLIVSFSEEHCNGELVDRNDCKWYHGSWKFLKAFGLVSCPEWHTEFYVSNIGKKVKEIELTGSILICGLADDGTLAMVHRSIHDLQPEPLITIIDMCPTPMYAVDLYLRKTNIKTVSKAQCIVPLIPFRSESFDVIVTDAFLTRFTAEWKTAVVEEWYRILRKDGVIVTTARIEADGISKSIAGDEARKAFVSLVRLLSQKHGLNPIEMADRAEEYSRKMTSYPFQDVEEIYELFKDYQTEISVPENFFWEISPKRYARIVAKKL